MTFLILQHVMLWAPAECAIEVPQSLLLHAGLATADTDFGAAFSALAAEVGRELADRFLLCLVLLVERVKGASSAWSPYISMLPQTYGLHFDLCLPSDLSMSSMQYPRDQQLPPVQ